MADHKAAKTALDRQKARVADYKRQHSIFRQAQESAFTNWKSSGRTDETKQVLDEATKAMDDYYYNVLKPAESTLSYMQKDFDHKYALYRNS